MPVDSSVFPIKFDITGGEAHDSEAAPKLIEKLPYTNYLIADEGYDIEPIRYLVRTKKVTSCDVKPKKGNAKIGNLDIGWCLYKYRHIVENAFARLMPLSQYYKLQRTYASTLILGCYLLGLIK